MRVCAQRQARKEFTEESSEEQLRDEDLVSSQPLFEKSMKLRENF